MNTSGPSTDKKPSDVPWWVRSDLHNEVIKCSSSDPSAAAAWSVVAVQLYRNMRLVVGLLAVVIDGAQRGKEDAEALAKRIAADPMLLNTLRRKNLIDCREKGMAPRP